MNYERTVPFEGDFNNIAENAINILQPHGFEVISNNNTSIEYIRNRFITPKREKPIMGISNLTIQSENKFLIINADLSKMKRTFIILSLSSIAIDMVILPLIIITMVRNETATKDILIFAGILLSGLIVGIPMMNVIMKSQAAKSLDNIVNNIMS
jgi:hypothetical protein